MHLMSIMRAFNDQAGQQRSGCICGRPSDGDGSDGGGSDGGSSDGGGRNNYGGLW